MQRIPSVSVDFGGYQLGLTTPAVVNVSSDLYLMWISRLYEQPMKWKG